jgi:hypothetical protein
MSAIHLSNRPSIVGSKHNSANECANLPCSKKLLYLRSGFHGSPGGQFGATVEGLHAHQLLEQLGARFNHREMEICALAGLPWRATG